jgi:hypothetical protein
VEKPTLWNTKACPKIWQIIMLTPLERSSMKNTFARFAVAFCLFSLLAGCVGPLAVRPLLTTEEEMPAATPAATVLPSLSTEAPITLVVEELDDLTYWLGHWRTMRLAGDSPDDPVLQEVMNLLVGSAASLDLELSIETLASVEPYDEAEALVRTIGQSIGVRYGSIVQATFEIRYATQVADLLLWFVNDEMPVEEIQARSHAAANYLSAAVVSAQKAGLTGELLSEGLLLARDMTRGAEPLEASRNVFMWRIRVLSWLDTQHIADSSPDNAAPASASPVTVATENTSRDPDELFIAMGCIDCHYLEEPEDGIPLNNLIAPSLATLGERAANRVPGQDAATYVYNSIVDPHAYEVAGYDADLMPLTYAEEMTEAEIEALVAWLLTK